MLGEESGARPASPELELVRACRYCGSQDVEHKLATGGLWYCKDCMRYQSQPRIMRKPKEEAGGNKGGEAP